MESTFFNIPASGHGDNKPQPTIVEYSDEQIIRENITAAHQFRLINPAHITKAISIKDIIQGRIESTPLTPEEAKIKAVYTRNKEDFDLTRKALLAE